MWGSLTSQVTNVRLTHKSSYQCERCQQHNWCCVILKAMSPPTYGWVQKREGKKREKEEKWLMKLTFVHDIVKSVKNSIDFSSLVPSLSYPQVSFPASHAPRSHSQPLIPSRSRSQPLIPSRSRFQPLILPRSRSQPLIPPQVSFPALIPPGLIPSLFSPQASFPTSHTPSLIPSLSYPQPHSQPLMPSAFITSSMECKSKQWELVVWEARSEVKPLLVSCYRARV